MPGPPRVLGATRTSAERSEIAGRHLGPEAGVPPVLGTDAWAAILPSGRVSWLELRPQLASAQDANGLASAAERLQWRRAVRLRELRRALQRVARSIEADVGRLGRARRRRLLELRRTLLAGDVALGRRASRLLAEHRRALRRQVRKELASVRLLGRRRLWDQLVVASALPLFAAFGRAARPLAQENLTLALLLLVWLVGDDVADLLAGDRRRADRVRDTDVWTYLAPFANVLTGWLLLRGAQHERFVSGVSALGPPRPRAPLGTFLCEGTIDLSSVVAPDHLPDLVTFADPPAVAVVHSFAPPDPAIAATAAVRSIQARVTQGFLHLEVRLTVDPPATPLEDVQRLVPAVNVAWLVDTQEPLT